ncbi:MAG TPA: YigZ family protein [Methylophilaceae bacterium]
METIQRAGEAEQTINKSRFIARAEHCANEREVLQMLKKMASQHPHATHLAFAYQLKTPGGIVQRMNDAAEPSGTAGRPILQHIEGMGLVNVCVGVIRYYGGINLGTGGLARAYGSTARMALEASVRIPYVEMAEIRLEMDYGSFDIFCRDVEKLNGRILDKQFDASVHVRASVPAGDAAALQARYQRR